MRGRSPRFVPCTALGCMKLLQEHNIDLANKTSVVLGDSNIVGTPLSVLMRNRGAAIVTVCHGTSYRRYKLCCSTVLLVVSGPSLLQHYAIISPTNCFSLSPPLFDLWNVAHSTRTRKIIDGALLLKLVTQFYQAPLDSGV